MNLSEFGLDHSICKSISEQIREMRTRNPNNSWWTEKNQFIGEFFMQPTGMWCWETSFVKPLKNMNNTTIYSKSFQPEMETVKKIAKNSALVMIGQIFSIICSIITSILLVRYLGAEKFGKYSFVYAFLTLFQIFGWL